MYGPEGRIQREIVEYPCIDMSMCSSISATLCP